MKIGMSEGKIYLQFDRKYDKYSDSLFNLTITVISCMGQGGSCNFLKATGFMKGTPCEISHR
jgi:hypothetical protein